MQAVVAERGQMTIPYRLRQKLGITPRTVLDFHEEHGRLIADSDRAGAEHSKGSGRCL